MTQVSSSSNGKPKVYIAATGMITPLGKNSVNTTACVRAGVSAYGDSYQYNKKFYPMRMALIPDNALPPLVKELENISGLTVRQQRMLRIATPALHEALSTVTLNEAPPLFLAVPESFPGYDTKIKANFLDQLIVQSGAKIDRASSRLIATGRAGGIEVIDWAFKYFNATGKDVVLVGGVDTHMDLLLLGNLDSENRILAENITDGFTPGEGAGFLLLVSERVIEALPHEAVGILYEPGLADEPGHRYSQEPYRGDGLALAFQLAIKNGDGNMIEAFYTSLNGENFGAKEFGVASIRSKSAQSEKISTHHPADCFGDLGAAFGPVMIGIASASKHKMSLCYCSSEQRSRSAVLVGKI